MQNPRTWPQGKSDLAGFLGLLQYSRKSRWVLAKGTAMVLIASGLLMGSAKAMGHLTELLLNGASWPLLLIAASWILGFELLQVLFYYQGRIALSQGTNQVALGIREALFKKMSRLPIRYFDEQPMGRTITRLTSDVEGMESFFAQTLPRLLSAIITVISVLLAMLITDFSLGSLIVLSSLPALIFTIAMRKPVRFWLQEYKKKSAELNSHLAELINGLGVLKIFGWESWSSRHFEQQSKHLLASAYRLMNWNSMIRPIAALLCSLPLVIIIWWGGHLVLEQKLGLGLLVAYIRYAERYFKPIMQLSFELHLIQDALSSSDRVRSMLLQKDEREDQDSATLHQARVEGTICFEKVSLAYQPDRLVLKNLNFSITPGQKVALVGRTGSGKSSTIQLILGLYPASSGTIRIDEVPLSQWRLQELRQQIAYVSQDIVVIPASLRDNLLIGSTDLWDDEILWQASRKTGFAAVLEQDPRGLDRSIQGGDQNLSKGEQQLLAITRVMLRDPRILILDEATAHIDDAAEHSLQSALLHLMEGRTIFIIAHRLKTIESCDIILVFEDGEIIERGDHSSLMLQSGHYAQLIKRQFLDEHFSKHEDMH